MIESQLLYLFKDKFFKIRIFGTIGYTVASSLMGIILDLGPVYFGVSFLIWMFVVFATICKMPQSTVVKKEKTRISLDIFKDKKIATMVFSFFVAQIGLSMYYTFIPVRAVEYGINSSLYGFAVSLSALGEVVVFYFLDKVLSKYESMAVLIFCNIITAIRLFCFGVFFSRTILFVMSAIHLFSFAPVYYSIVHEIRLRIKEENYSSAMTTLWACAQAFGAFIGNVFGGQLIKYVGYNWTFSISSFAILLSLIVPVVYMKRNNLSVILK